MQWLILFRLLPLNDFFAVPIIHNFSFFAGGVLDLRLKRRVHTQNWDLVLKIRRGAYKPGGGGLVYVGHYCTFTKLFRT